MAAGHKTTIYKTDVSTPTLGESLSQYKGQNTLFMVANRTKQFINLDESYTFYEDGIPILDSDIEKISNYVGIVEFKTAKTGIITADYEYLTLDELCFAREVNITDDSGLLDNTIFCSTGNGFSTFEDSLRSGTGTLSGFVRTDNINDETLNQGGIILVINLSSNFQIATKLVTTSNTYSSAVDALITSNYNFNTDGEIQYYIT